MMGDFGGIRQRKKALVFVDVMCEKCGVPFNRFGKHHNGLQRFRCVPCGKTDTEEHKLAFRVEDYLKTKRGLMAIKLLAEGCSIRSIERVTGIRRDSTIDLLLIAGERCEKLMNRVIQDVPVRDVQADEIRSFVGKKEKKKTNEDDETLGDCYTRVGIEARTKLILAFVISKRTGKDAIEFTRKLRRATSATQRFQLTTDGLQALYSRRQSQLVGPMRLCATHQDLRLTPRRRAALLAR